MRCAHEFILRRSKTSANATANHKRRTGYSADVLQFMRLLRRFEVRCVVIGGEAVIFHGYPRLTGDIDFFYDCAAANAGRLYEALSEFWVDDIPGI